jgi:hypothetical protein
MADAVVSGEFQVAQRFPPQKLGLPPDWSANPTGDDNWQSSLQGLDWLMPLMHAHAGRPEGGYLQAAARVIEDWIRHSPFRGAPSRWSWHDHASAKRLRLFAWLWELYRQDGAFDAQFARLLLASIYQHVLYHLDERNYRRDSNHGLEAIGALLAAALTFAMFRDSGRWRATALGRLEQWIGDNLSPEGFHIEQSPAYHWFVVLRLAAMDRFLRANGAEQRWLSEAMGRAAAAWPHLVKPNGEVPTVGDSGPEAPADWPRILALYWGRAAPAGDTHASGFIISPRAGYAIWRAGAGDEQDLYALFRCRAFESPHCHYDALSFVLYGLGRDWLVDPGYLNYHEWDPRRRYLRSPRAHSLVLVGERGFRTGESGVVESGRGEAGDHVTSFHVLPGVRHTRRVLVAGPRQVRIDDRVQRGGRPVVWRQLFQIATGLQVHISSATEARLVASDGNWCAIRQSAPGTWTVVEGQRKPHLQGWHSPRYGAWEPRPTLSFRPGPGVGELQTSLLLLQSPRG